MSNKELMASFYVEVFQKGNIDYVDEVTSNAVWHDVPPGQPATTETIKAVGKSWHEAFTDQEWDVETMVEEGDLVTWCGTFRGTHTGELSMPGTPSIPATGKSVECRNIDVVRFKDGKCVEHWGVVDVATMMMQMGLMG